jgi:hypothetical protein
MEIITKIIHFKVKLCYTPDSSRIFYTSIYLSSDGFWGKAQVCEYEIVGLWQNRFSSFSGNTEKRLFNYYNLDY